MLRGKCSFCSDNVNFQLHYQERETAKVVDDLQELNEKYGVRHFAFSDEAISPTAISKLSDEIIKRGMAIHCSANIRFEHQFTEELCNKMNKAGFKLLYLGLESACDRILKLMNKGIKKDVAAEVCKNIHKANIWNHLYVLIGFPSETKAEAKETIDFLILNKNIIRSFNIGSFVLYKSAPMMKYPKRYEINRVDVSKNTVFNLAYNYTVSSGLTCTEAQELSNYYLNNIAQEYTNNDFLKFDGEDILLYLSHFERCDLILKPTEIGNKKSDKCLTLNSKPKSKECLVYNELRFNIFEIIKI
jgi:radical SAM superfamily enzyme YgiQ (UPF0313 family)